MTRIRNIYVYSKIYFSLQSMCDFFFNFVQKRVVCRRFHLKMVISKYRMID